jgi:hypothetical protein
MAAPDVWPKVGDPCLGFDRRPDCPATDDPARLGDLVYCTRDAGHAPPHVADGVGEIVHVWVSDDDLRAIAEAHPEGAARLLAFLFTPERSDQ